MGPVMIRASARKVFRIMDGFTVALIIVVGIATVLPCRGRVDEAFDAITTGAIALLFFLHGAKLSRRAMMAGIAHWRLHLAIFSATFVVFPLLGFLLRPVAEPLVTPVLYTGVLFLCVLPSTVQSSIAFTSIAGGNVSAAICSASASNMFAVVLTPVLTRWLVADTHEALPMVASIRAIVLQILIPFVAGQIARRWIGEWIQRRRLLVRCVDQGSILLVVYTAFSAAMVEGLWTRVSWQAVAGLAGISVLLLGLVLGATWMIGRLCGFERADRITLMFCGSKKSLASGAPIAKVLFDASAVGVMVLPLMMFHQLQLMVCAMLAQKWARGAEEKLPSGGQ